MTVYGTRACSPAPGPVSGENQKLRRHTPLSVHCSPVDSSGTGEQPGRPPTGEWTQMCCVCVFFRLLSLMGYCIILSIAPCAAQGDLAGYLVCT